VAYPCEGLGSLPPTTIVKPGINTVQVNESIQAGPNPMQDRFVVTLQDIARVEQAACEIFSAAGSLVATVNRLTGNLLIWDGNDMQGRKASPGIYLFKVGVNGKQAGGKVFKVGQ
jgi:hypothetical protein